MSAAVARGHGGDGGADPPPPNPNRIPTICQTTWKQKKKRGISRSKNLDIAFVANDKKPLSIEFDLTEGTYKPIGPNASKFIRYLGNLIGHGTSPYHSSWNGVCSDFKKSIIRKLRRFFILDETAPEWPNILAGIERDCQDRYRDRKAKLKTHFKKVGGYDDVASARRNRPQHLDTEKWNKTVDLFCDSKHRSRSEKNAENRSHAKYPSLHGSTSYIATRYKKRNPETQELQGPIDNWHHAHHRPKGGWVNDLARIDHEAMLREQAAQTQEHGSTSSSVKEKEIMTKVLGECRGHNRGIGRKLKGSAFSSIFEPPPQPQPQPQQLQPFSTDGIIKVFDAINDLSRYVHQMYAAPPGTQLPPPPIIDTHALFAAVMAGQPSQQPPQQPPQHDEDGDEDTDTDSYQD